MEWKIVSVFWALLFLPAVGFAWVVYFGRGFMMGCGAQCPVTLDDWIAVAFPFFLIVAFASTSKWAMRSPRIAKFFIYAPVIPFFIIVAMLVSFNFHQIVINVGEVLRGRLFSPHTQTVHELLQEQRLSFPDVQ